MKLAIKHLKWHIGSLSSSPSPTQHSIRIKAFQIDETEKNLQCQNKSYREDIIELKQAIQILEENYIANLN